MNDESCNNAPNLVRAAHDRYVDRGLDAMPLKARTKKPDMGNEWQDRDWTPEEVRAAYRSNSNIGFRTGARSAGVCDVDLDCQMALRIAPQVLPATDMVFGRPGAPASHRLYQCDPVPPTKKFSDPVSRDTLIELRSNKHQTMLPPSVHPDNGERLEWVSQGEPARVNGMSLLADVKKVAACSVLAIHAPVPGRKQRHDFYLALAGGLLKGGMSDDDAVSVVSLVCMATEDDDADGRVSGIADTRLKLDAGQAVVGFEKLRTMVDPKVVDAVVEWLGLDARPASKFSPVDALVDMGLELPLIRTEHAEHFAAIPLNDQVEAVELRDDRFRNHLLREYRLRHRTVAPPSAISNAVAMLSALAEAEPITELEARCLRRGDTLHVNLGAGKQALLSPSGWRVIEDAESDVMFRKPSGQGVLPVPECGGSVLDLRPFINATDEQFVLFVGYIVSVFGGGPYVFLVINGERGSAKSTATRIVTALTDPCDAAIQLPTDVRNLFVTVREHLVLPCENVTSIKGDISNALCSIATGTIYYHRVMGSDRDRVAFKGYGSLVMNGIEDFAKSNDLRQRSIILNLKRLKATKHEGTLRAQFEIARPRILGAIFDAVCMGLARQEQTTLSTNPRMYDAVRFVTAAEHALPWPVGTFEKGFQRNQNESESASLDGSHVALAIVEMMEEEGYWRGSWTVLKGRLERTRHYMSGNVPSRRWPSDGRELSDEITRYTPTLRERGIEVEPGQRIGKGGDRGAIIRWIDGHDEVLPTAPPAEADTADATDETASAPQPASSRGTDNADKADNPTFNNEQVEVLTDSAITHREAQPAESLSATSAVSADCTWCDFGDLPEDGMHDDEPCPRFPNKVTGLEKGSTAGDDVRHADEDDIQTGAEQ